MKQSEIDDINEMYSHYNYSCFICGIRASQRSHAIGNTKPNRKIFGNEIIDNPLNWLPACTISHNALIDLGKNYILMDKVAQLIRSDKQDKRILIEEIVRENIKRKQDKLSGGHNE